MSKQKKEEKRQPYLKFYCSDWRGDPRLRMCSLAARGLWIDLITYAHEGEPYGHLTIDGKVPDLPGIAALVARPLKEVKAAIAELEERNVFSRADNGAIVSRRMVRDKAKSEASRECGENGGNPEIRRGTVPKSERVRPFRRSDAPEKTKRIFERNGGKCHWCEVPLQFHPDGIAPNGFHVDHVIAICDGGTNDENNLVAACAVCNHKRARQVNVGSNSDVKLITNASTKDQKEKKEDAPDGASSKYFFESGIIRLSEKDFRKWKEAFSNLDLRAELIGLTQWAEHQNDWFFAVSGALAKRNREIGIALKSHPQRPEARVII